jgi:hypothetical protein
MAVRGLFIISEPQGGNGCAAVLAGEENKCGVGSTPGAVPTALSLRNIVGGFKTFRRKAVRMALSNSNPAFSRHVTMIAMSVAA